jgi:acetyl esterase/lipase
MATTEPVLLSAETKPVKTRMGVNAVPSLTPFYPEAGKGNGAAIIVCPGGGYGALMDTYEGADVCRWWNERGVTAFLLRYRIAPDRYPAALEDAQGAIREVRKNAAEYGVDPHKVGIIGFSAGGHLAASAATLFHEKSRGGVSDRPDFAVLVYPVISMVPPYGHAGSAANLLGPSPREGLAEELSVERRVSERTPPCFVVQGRDDRVVDWHNAQAFYDACQAHGVPARLDLLEHGPHGFGLKTPQAGATPWTEECVAFLRSVRVLPAGE